MISNSVFLSPIVSFYFILCILFYSFLFFFIEISDIRIEFIEKQTKRYAIVSNDMLGSLCTVCLVANGDTHPQPMRGGTT